jgi:deoxyribonuclease V
MSFPQLELPDLPAALTALVAQVPAGRVATCGMLAEALGNRVAARWVAHFALHHEHHSTCPCHRIVRADGRLGPYIGGSTATKARLLRREGVAFHGGSVVLEECGFSRFSTDRPLEKLRHLQEALAARVVIQRCRQWPSLVAGVDVAYPQDDQGMAAYALVDCESGELVWAKTIRRQVVFPYITGFLGFRELPILLELLAEVQAEGRLARLLLVDGSGVLHPRRAGSAAHLGVLARLPTIGVTKTLLCGEVEPTGIQPGEARAVLLLGQAAGMAFRPNSRSHKLLYVSPGHLVDAEFALRVVARLCRGRFLPEPLYWADLLSKGRGVS